MSQKYGERKREERDKKKPEVHFAIHRAWLCDEQTPVAASEIVHTHKHICCTKARTRTQETSNTEGMQALVEGWSKDELKIAPSPLTQASPRYNSSLDPV